MNGTMSMLAPDIYFGRRVKAVDLDRMHIKTVIHLSTLPTKYSVRTVSCPIKDGWDNDPKDFLGILWEIDMAVKNGLTPVYIQCNMGLSRSVVVAALYSYHKKWSPSFENALEEVKKIHPSAMPDPYLVKFVKERVLPLMR
jgi:protein-tyrosine phosphatase